MAISGAEGCFSRRQREFRSEWCPLLQTSPFYVVSIIRTAQTTEPRASWFQVQTERGFTEHRLGVGPLQGGAVRGGKGLGPCPSQLVCFRGFNSNCRLPWGRHLTCSSVRAPLDWTGGVGSAGSRAVGAGPSRRWPRLLPPAPQSPVSYLFHVSKALAPQNQGPEATLSTWLTAGPGMCNWSAPRWCLQMGASWQTGETWARDGRLGFSGLCDLEHLSRSLF